MASQEEGHRGDGDSGAQEDQPKDDAVGLTGTIYQLLEERSANRVIELLEDEANKEEVQAAAWDLIPRVCSYLTDTLQESEPEFVGGCAQILTVLAEVTKPKELLLVLLEQADTFKDDVKFLSLLPPIQHCLQALPEKKTHSLAVALETLNAHVSCLTLPDDHQYEGDQRKLLDLDDHVQRCNDVVKAMVEFIQPFVMEVSWKKTSKDVRKASKNLIKELSSSLLRMLAHPVAFLDLTDVDDEKKGKSNSRAYAEHIVELLTHLQTNHYTAIQEFVEEAEDIKRKQKLKSEMTEKCNGVENGDIEAGDVDIDKAIPDLGLAVYGYLVFGEKQGTESVPQMLSLPNLLYTNCPFVATLLSSDHSIVKMKGVSLFHSLCDPLREESIPADFLEMEWFREAGTKAIQTIIMCPVKDIRQNALAVLPKLLSRFELIGRYKMIQQILSSANHSGLIGYTIGLLKTQIDTAIKEEEDDDNCFLGSTLAVLLNIGFKLPENETTDLLENSEGIMAALNLLRYLVLRDPPSQNRTGIWTMLPLITTNFIDHLHKGLKMSRAHYELEIENTKKEKSKKKGEPDMLFTVSGQPMPGISKKKQIDTLTTALHMFDMMESILARINEVVDQQKAK